MVFLETTYKTLTGSKKIIEIPGNKNTQWVVYQDNQPKYFVDFYDLEKESNAMMNSLVLCTQRTLSEVLELINKRNNIYLSIPKIARIGFRKKIKSTLKNLDLKPIPKEWLSYSL